MITPIMRRILNNKNGLGGLVVRPLKKIIFCASSLIKCNEFPRTV